MSYQQSSLISPPLSQSELEKNNKAMSNFTFEQKLVEQLPISGILSGGKPVGREGFEVIVMEHIDTGWRYYCSLAPGDMLRLVERLFGRFSALVVDIRPARQLDIETTLPTLDPLIKVTVRAQILYRVTDPRRVAVEVEDPLAKFRDRIIGMLRREISRRSYQQVSELLCEGVINSVGDVPQFGLAVEGVDFLLVEQDSAVLDQMRQRAQLDYDQGLGIEVEDSEHQKRMRRQYRDMEHQFRQDQFDTLRNSQQNMNDRMQRVLDNYIAQNPDLDPEELREQIRATFDEVSERPRITFGSNSTIGQPSRRITLGKPTDSHALPSVQPNNTSADRDDDDDDDILHVPSKKNIQLFALANALIEEGDVVIVSKTYTVQAGLSPQEIDGFISESMDVPVNRPDELIPIDILCHESEHIKLLSDWQATIYYRADQRTAQFVEFLFRALKPGQASISIDFHHKQRWLRTISFEFEAVEATQPVPVQPEE
jgi:hypothetical protein